MIAAGYLEGYPMGPPNRGLKRGKYESRQLEDIHAIVVHTTGAGLIRRYNRESRWSASKQTRVYGRTLPPAALPPTGIRPVDTALRVYSQLMDAGPHFVVDQDGNVFQTCPLHYAAWHVGRSKSWAYWAKNTVSRSPKYNWWRERWPTIDSPSQIAKGKLWLGNQCNRNTVGIEVVPPVDDPRGIGPWSMQCWLALTRLFRALSSNLDIPLDRWHIVGHADAHPHSRTAKGLPWDPTPSQMSPAQLERWLSATEQRGM